MKGEHKDLQDALRKMKSGELQGHIVRIQQELDVTSKDQKLNNLNASKSKLEQELRKIEGSELPEIGMYSGLADLPCILVLCEKGKMGDSFPQSLRFFDLRLRYANPDANSPIYRASIEQDLERGFGYEQKGVSLYPRPLILVPVSCFEKLRQKRGGRVGLFRFDPDKSSKITTKGANKAEIYPTKEADLEAYRKWGAGEKHFDSQWSNAQPCTTLDANAEGQNPRRFLLIGRPQIG